MKLKDIKTYRNQHHLRNCYIQFDLNDEVLFTSHLFYQLYF